MATVLFIGRKEMIVYLLFTCQIHANTQIIDQSLVVAFEPCVLKRHEICFGLKM